MNCFLDLENHLQGVKKITKGVTNDFRRDESKRF